MRRTNIVFRALAVVMFLVFTLWIVPLGAYIDVVMEDVLCSGKRAICLCSKNFKSPQQRNAKTKIATGEAGYQSYSSASRSVTTPYLMELARWIHQANTFSYQTHPQFLQNKPYIKTIEHVPKSA